MAKMTFAEAIKAGNYANVGLCTDCMVALANGDVRPDRPEDLPEVLGEIPASADLTPGLLAEEHSEHCMPEDREEGCDCETDPFSTSRCDGCGDTNHGERHMATLAYDVR